MLSITGLYGQTITSIAGTDWVFPSGELAATDAPLGYAFGVATDSAGNFYVADSDNNIVVRISSNGRLTVVAGNGRRGFSGDGGPATGASLSSPSGIAIDSAGNVYIADTRNDCVRKVTVDGIISRVAGTGRTGYSGDGGPATSAAMNSPEGIVLDSAGNLYIADVSNSRIRKLAPNGIITTVAGNGQLGSGGDGGIAVNVTLFAPTDVAIDASGVLYIADSGNHRIRKVALNGILTTVAGVGRPGYSGDGGPATSAFLDYPAGVALDSAGAIYISDSFNRRIRKVAPNGTITTIAGNGLCCFSGDGGPATAGALSSPLGGRVDSKGNLYIADSSNYRVRQVSPTGVIRTVAGNGNYRFSGDAGPAVAATFNAPSGVAISSAGDLYIADLWGNRVRKVDASGVITTVAGNGTPGYSGDGGSAATAQLHLPNRVAIDAASNLYVVDSANNMIRKVSPSGLISRVAGNGQSAFSGDGGPATGASLYNPTDAAIGPSGNVYILDAGNGRIRKVTSDGVITTVAGNGTEGFSGDGGPATRAAFGYLAGVAVDSQENLFVADYSNHRVRKVTSTGNILTVAGNGTAAFSGDGGAATSASLNKPFAVISEGGDLYIADAGNHRVRKVASDGIIQTIAGGGNVISVGVPATLEFFSPADIKRDISGNLLIVDSAYDRILEVLSGVTTYQVSSVRLDFSADAGGGVPVTQTIDLTSTVPGQPFTAVASANWLNISPERGAFPAVLRVSVDPSGLTPGTYSATITINVPFSAPASTTVNVYLTVQRSASAKLAVDSQNVSFTATQGSGALTQQLHVSNSGGSSLSFTASATTSSGSTWLSISSASGTATPSSPASLTVSATPGSLAPGTYSGTVAITGAGNTISVPVTLSVSAPSAIILVSQSALSFSAVAQGGVPLPQNFGILNTGQGSMGWTATASTLSGGNWLKISPSSGTVQRPYLDVSLVTVTIDPSTLAAGTYYGRIQVSASAANTPQVMTVILTVLPTGLSLGPQIFPTGLIFTGVAGATPGSQDVQVANPTGQVNNFQSGLIGAGFSFLPANASIQPNQPTTVRVFPDFSNLTPGSIQQGTITLQFSDRSPSQTINVLTVVAPSGAAANNSGAEVTKVTGPRAASGCAAQGWNVQFRSLQPNFTAVLGQATAVDVQIADGCGSLVGPGGQSAYVAATVTGGDPLMAMTHIGNGIWQGTWKPVNAAGGVTLFVTAVGPNGVGGQNKVSGAVSIPSPAATTPTVTAKGAVHAASNQGGVPIAPGGLMTVYGVNLADGVGQSKGLPLPQQLNGTQVLLGNQALPILYTSTGQLNVQVPYGVPVNTQYQLTVQHGTTLSVPQQLVVAQAQPGIFTVNQQGTGQGSIVKSDGVTLAQAGTPASIGETVVIYCTGLGAVTPAVKEGSPAPATPPLSTTVNPVTVTIGGQAAQVTFSGLTPGYAGLYQINAVAPSGIVTGDLLPVVVSVAGQTSPAVTMAVR
jgi:uncharacterized protein (TIGR03437 family)